MKIKVFCVCVALALIFSACNKDVSDQIVDEDAFDVSIKGFEKLEAYEDEGEGIAFTWNSITASDFGKGVTPPFNNWSKPLGEGIIIYRTPAGDNTVNAGVTNLLDGQTGTSFLTNLQATNQKAFGNGNDPVWIWFDYIEIGKQLLKKEIGLDAEMTVLVKYKASNNVAFTFNLVKASVYCFFRGPISLDCTTIGHTNLGAVTQVRLEPVDVGSTGVDATVCVVDQNGAPVGCLDISDPEKCPILSELDPDFVTLAAQITLEPNQVIDHWVNAATGAKVAFPLEVCGDISLKPVIKTTVTVCVEGNADCFEIEAVGECPVLTWDDFNAEKYMEGVVLGDRQKFAYWTVNGEVFEEGKSFPSNCDDMTIGYVLADFEGYRPVSATKSCGSNVATIAFTFVEVFSEGVEGDDELVLGPLMFGGSDTNPALNWDDISAQVNSLGCGNWNEKGERYFLTVKYKVGEFEDIVAITFSCTGDEYGLYTGPGFENGFKIEWIQE